MRFKEKVWIVAAGLLLAACDPKSLPPSTIAPICTALHGPTCYNPTNVMSQRYAAYLLALDLHQRNEIGRKLGCPQFQKGADQCSKK